MTPLLSSPPHKREKVGHHPYPTLATPFGD
jgi:hypothetical protein